MNQEVFLKLTEHFGVSGGDLGKTLCLTRADVVFGAVGEKWGDFHPPVVVVDLSFPPNKIERDEGLS